MRHNSITKYGLVLLASVLVSYVQCDEYNALYVFSTDDEFLLLLPSYKKCDEFVLNLTPLRSASHLYYVCPNPNNVLEFHEIEEDEVSTADHKCEGNPVKTSAILVGELKKIEFEDVVSQISLRQIGYKVKNTEVKSEGSDAKTPRQFKFIPVITVETDALTASTKMVYYRCLSSLGMPIPADTEVDKMPFNKNEDVYEGHNFDLDTLYAESYRKNPKNHLVKQQLAAADDFLLDTLKDLTFHNLNTAPMRNMYTKRWRAIEDRIRDVLPVLINAYLGVGTAMFPTRSEDEKEYMKDRFVLIPDIFWKIVAIVHNLTKDVSGIIIIMHGHPDIFHKPVCQNTCRQNNWTGISNSEHYTGLTYCCDLNRKNMKKLNIELGREFPVDTEYHPLNLGAVHNETDLVPRIKPAQPLKLLNSLEITDGDEDGELHQH